APLEKLVQCQLLRRGFGRVEDAYHRPVGWTCQPLDLPDALAAVAAVALARRAGGRPSSTDKRYAGDNRLIPPKSSYRRGSLAPRCRLITSWGCSRSQGYGCSPFKVVRELGLKRRETVWSLSAVGVGRLRGAAPSTRGPEWTHLWCTGCHASGIAG